MEKLGFSDHNKSMMCFSTEIYVLWFPEKNIGLKMFASSNVVAVFVEWTQGYRKIYCLNFVQMCTKPVF